MKKNQQILDEFGKHVVQDTFDSSYGSILEIINDTCPNLLLKETSILFQRFNNEEKELIKKYLFETISGTLHDFLRIFEENEQFKLIYEEGETQVDLNKISEMLKAEPIIEGGWIERFSKELNK